MKHPISRRDFVARGSAGLAAAAVASSLDGCTPNARNAAERTLADWLQVKGTWRPATPTVLLLIQGVCVIVPNPPYQVIAYVPKASDPIPTHTTLLYTLGADGKCIANQNAVPFSGDTAIGIDQTRCLYPEGNRLADLGKLWPQPRPVNRQFAEQQSAAIIRMNGAVYHGHGDFAVWDAGPKNGASTHTVALPAKTLWEIPVADYSVTLFGVKYAIPQADNFLLFDIRNVADDERDCSPATLPAEPGPNDPPPAHFQMYYPYFSQPGDEPPILQHYLKYGPGTVTAQGLVPYTCMQGGGE